MKKILPIITTFYNKIPSVILSKQMTVKIFEQLNITAWNGVIKHYKVHQLNTEIIVPDQILISYPYLQRAIGIIFRKQLDPWKECRCSPK